LCNISYNSTTGILLANVSSFSNYTTTNVDIAAPIISLLTPDNNAWNNSPAPGFTFNFTDDSSPNASCTLYLNGTARGTNGTANNNTNTIITANTSLTSGARAWYINCTDASNNTGQSVTRTLNTDTVNPEINNITISNITTSSATFIVNATDAASGMSSCIYNLSNNAGNGTLNLSSGLYTKGVTGLSASTYYNLTITCTDNVSNTNTSLANFTTSSTSSSSSSGGGGRSRETITIVPETPKANETPKQKLPPKPTAPKPAEEPASVTPVEEALKTEEKAALAGQAIGLRLEPIIINFHWLWVAIITLSLLTITGFAARIYYIHMARPRRAILYHPS
ncbi:hypothetical protein HZC32_00060, partial [Candidatus Woesearchaeota archaeon]|nr:hypothetical protein [Candidatus Woesearchaeota archaeon]